jgi:hypothetical protein
MLVSAVEQLSFMAQGRHYKEAANLVDAVRQVIIALTSNIYIYIYVCIYIYIYKFIFVVLMARQGGHQPRF